MSQLLRTLLLVGALLLGGLWTEHALAQGHRNLSASVQLGTTFTSNAFNLPEWCRGSKWLHCEEKAVYFTLAPSVQFQQDFAFGKFSLDAGLTAYLYTPQGKTDNRIYDLSGVDPRLSRVFGNVRSALTFPFGSRLTLTLGDRFVPKSMDFSDTPDSRTNLVQNNTATLLLHYEIPLMGPWTGFVSGNFERWDIFLPHSRWDIWLKPFRPFPGGEPDRITFGGGGRIERRLGRRSTTGLEGNIRRIRFDQEHPRNALDPDVQVDQTDFMLLGTWDYRLRQALTLSLGGGWTGFKSHLWDNYTYALQARLLWKPQSRTSLSINFDRAWAARLDAFVLATTGIGRLAYSFAINSVSARFEHHLTRHLTARLSSGYRRISNAQDVPTLLVLGIPSPGHNDLFTLRPEVEYEMGRYFLVQAGYEYARSGSGAFKDDNFGRHVTSLTLTATY